MRVDSVVGQHGTRRWIGFEERNEVRRDFGGGVGVVDLLIVVGEGVLG